jgi:hypothetical protein
VPGGARGGGAVAGSRAGAITALELWDYESWDGLAARQVQFARDTGALALLQLAVGQLAWTRLVAGELATAARLVEEDRLIAEATSNPSGGYPAMVVAAWRGREPQASELIEATAREAAARGMGRVVNYASHASSVLYNGLGRHDAACDAARLAFERDPVGYGPLVVPELAEAAARTGDLALVTAALDWLSERTRVTPNEWALVQPADRRAAVHQHAHGPVPPGQGLHQARHHLPQPARPSPARRLRRCPVPLATPTPFAGAPLASLTGPSRCGLPATHWPVGLCTGGYERDPAELTIAGRQTPEKNETQCGGAIP